MVKVLFTVFIIIGLGSTSLSGLDLYNQCAGCHGEKGEKTALDRSKILNQMGEQEIIDALKGYKNNTYGGSMKGLMKVQVKKLTMEEIEQIAKFISKK